MENQVEQAEKQFLHGLSSSLDYERNFILSIVEVWDNFKIARVSSTILSIKLLKGFKNSISD